MYTDIQGQKEHLGMYSGIKGVGVRSEAVFLTETFGTLMTSLAGFEPSRLKGLRF